MWAPSTASVDEARPPLTTSRVYILAVYHRPISVHPSSPLYTYDWATLTPVRSASNDLELDISGYDFKGRGVQSNSPPLKAHEVTFLNVNLGSNNVPAMDVANWTKTHLLSFGTSSGVGTMTSRQPVSGGGFDTGTDLKITSDPLYCGIVSSTS